MEWTEVLFSFVIFGGLFGSSLSNNVNPVPTKRSVRIAKALTDASPITLNEDDLYQRIELKAESVGRDGTVTPVDFGDLEIKYVLSTGTPATGDVEPGFDFVPDIGPLPATATVTIKEGESESSLFVLQILDDCIEEVNEPITITPVGTIAYTDMGSSYSVDQTTLTYEIDSNSADGAGSVEIHMDIEHPSTVGLVFYEGEKNTVIPIKGLESCTGREVPIDDICTASIDHIGSNELVNPGLYSISNQVIIDSDTEEFSITVGDNDVYIGPPIEIDIAFAQAACVAPLPALTSHTLADGDQLRITIIDDDEPRSAAIVYPAAIGRKEARDVTVCATTSAINTPTQISGNDKVCPYITDLPQCKSTDLNCDRCGEDNIGRCTTFPKPKRHSRDRFGSYIVTVHYPEEQTIPVFIRPLTDVLKPLSGPTITISNYEDVHIGVEFSTFAKELRWYFNGRELKKLRGRCEFEIYRAEHGVHDGYYEVTRAGRGDSGYRTVVRLIIRSCEKGYFRAVDSNCYHVPTFTCHNGGVLKDTVVAGQPECECPLGFDDRSSQCVTVDPGHFRIGRPGKKLTCRDIDPSLPRDCKGALICYPGLLGCLCPRGYWGPKCDRVCPHGRYGWSCLQRCHCTGPWEACDPKTGICKVGCKAGYEGPNCQQKND